MRRIANPLRNFALVVLSVIGCSSGSLALVGKEGPPKTRFADTMRSQRAIFFTSGGSVGGPGAADVLLDPADPPSGRKPTVNGQTLLLTPESLAMIRKRLPRPTPEGARYILVEAKVHVEERSGRISNNPPRTQSYHGVVIEKLTRVQWHTPPAE